jgi:Ca-activated chloride channel homolog
MNAEKSRKYVILVLFLGAVNLFAGDPGQRAYDNEEYEKSLSYYLKKLDKDKNNEILHFNAGTSALKAGRDELAASHFEQGIRNGDDPEFRAKNWYNLGHLLVKNGQMDHSLKAFEQAILYDPDDLNSKYMYEVIHSQRQEEEDQEDQESQDEESGEDEQSRDASEDDKKDKEEKETPDQEEEQTDENEQQQEDDISQNESTPSDTDSDPEYDEEDMTEQQVVNLLDAMREREKEAMKEILKYRFQDTKLEREKDW